MGIKIASLVAVMAAVIAAVILNVTSPISAGPLGILALFICLYVLFICVSYIVIVVSRRLVVRFFNSKFVAERSYRKVYYYSTVVALAPTVYVGMQSMGDVGIFEAVLLVIFELLACFFIHKRY